MGEEADRNYEEAARKLALIEADLERSEERAEIGESKIVELEEEVKVVSNNLKSLEATEFQATKSEETYSDQIQTLSIRCKEAEGRAEVADRAVQRLQREIDKLENTLMDAKDKNNKLEEEMEAVFRDIQNL